jgi:hypothetical protein
MIGVVHEQDRRTAGHAERQRGQDVPRVNVQHDDVRFGLRERPQGAGARAQRAHGDERADVAAAARGSLGETGRRRVAGLVRQHDGMALPERIARDPATQQRGMTADGRREGAHVQPAMPRGRRFPARARRACAYRAGKMHERRLELARAQARQPAMRRCERGDVSPYCRLIQLAARLAPCRVAQAPRHDGVARAQALYNRVWRHALPFRRAARGATPC